MWSGAERSGKDWRQVRREGWQVNELSGSMADKGLGLCCDMLDNHSIRVTVFEAARPLAVWRREP